MDRFNELLTRRVSVIAVCGLGGHALGSFKEKNGPFVWVRDGLPSDVPNARVFTYGYDTQLVESRSFQNLSDLGRALQVDLEGIRVCKSQPYFFRLLYTDTLFRIQTNRVLYSS